MAFAYTFDAKVVNQQAVDNRTPRMAPEARSGRTLMVVVILKKFLEEDVDQDARLR